MKYKPEKIANGSNKKQRPGSRAVKAMQDKSKLKARLAALERARKAGVWV